MKKQITEKMDSAVDAAPDQAAPEQQESTRAKTKTASTGNGAENAAKTTAATVSPLGETSKTVDDRAKLKQCEDIIRANEGSEFATGRCLAQIKIDHLYKVAGFTAFDAYTRERWGMSDKHAYRLINAAKCYYILAEHKGGKNWVLPRSETHIRPLTKLGKTELVSTWEKVVEKFAGQQFTAEDIHDFLDPAEAPAAAATANAGTKVAKVKVAAKAAKRIQAKLEKNLAKIDKLVEKALEKAADKETIPVKAYQTLLEKIKKLIAASK